MSLEIVVTNGIYAVVVSDGLEWNGNRIISKHAQKQIRLGPDIAIAAGGYSHEMLELFDRCKDAYGMAPANAVNQLAAVRNEFHRTFEGKRFPGFGQTCLGGILVAREGGGFVLIKQHSGGKPEIRRVSPGDEPVFEFYGPGTLAETPAHSVKFFRATSCFKEATPARAIANLHAIYGAAVEIDPKSVNLNLRVNVIGDVPAGEPCGPDPEIIAVLNRTLEACRRAFEGQMEQGDSQGTEAGACADNAITNNGEYSHDAAVTIGAAETDLGSVTISTNGGNVEVYAKLSAVNSGVNVTVTLRLRKDSLTGTILDQCFLFVSASQPGTVSLMGIDSSPAASQSYHVTGLNGGPSVSAEFLRIIAANRKR